MRKTVSITIPALGHDPVHMTYVENYAKADESLTALLPVELSGLNVTLFFLDNQWIPLGEYKPLR